MVALPSFRAERNEAEKSLDYVIVLVKMTKPRTESTAKLNLWIMYSFKRLLRKLAVTKIEKSLRGGTTKQSQGSLFVSLTSLI